MKTFTQIIVALGGGGPWVIGNGPQLTVTHNAGGAGFVASLIFSLNAGVHITIYQNSWDGVAQIVDYGGHNVDVGPYCLHLTAAPERWFRQRFGPEWMWVTDYGTPNAKVVRAFETFFEIMWPCLK